jgi:hypothetical protein
VEDSPENFAFFRQRKIVKFDLVLLEDRIGPRGANDEAIGIADDLKRRIFQRRGVAHQLVHRSIKVALLLFVFPGKEILLPDVGEAFAAAGLGGSLLEGKPFASGVRRNRVLVLEQHAEIEEVGMGSRPLGERDRFPFFDEFGGSHDPAIAGNLAGKNSPPISL